ncbi:hypothetical protein BURMUCGD1_1674 [Burkholderia multivorans CGD1]|nr:hypothetical protein BURMUCGD1_1674 [Burkholderia multivorans CGD1]
MPIRRASRRAAHRHARAMRGPRRGRARIVLLNDASVVRVSP